MDIETSHTATTAERIYGQIGKRAQPGQINESISKLLTEVSSGLQNDSSLRCKIQKHPLGFLAIRWDLSHTESLRIHLWDKGFSWKQHPDWQIHNHVFGFTSLVVSGCIQNKTYKRSKRKEGRWPVYEVAYEGGRSILNFGGEKISLDSPTSTLQITGEYYSLTSAILHRSVLRSSQAITALATSYESGIEQKPLVIGSGEMDSYSFDRSSSSDQDLWRVVNEFAQLLEKNHK